jgi:hypothetical protein
MAGLVPASGRTVGTCTVNVDFAVAQALVALGAHSG